jgi:sialidase-1
MDERAIDRTLRLAPGPSNPRNSEGDFVRLADGRWLFIYTHFVGGAGDHAAAHLAGRLSEDDGVTWSGEDHLVLPNEAAMNVMSVSLLRLADGRIALFYLRKESEVDCRPTMRTSADESRAWSAPVQIVPEGEADYYVVNNDRVVQLAGGRLVVPAARHRRRLDAPTFSAYGEALCLISDDGGATWRHGRAAAVEARADGVPVVIQEPGVVVLRDGRLMMFCRTDAGSQYLAYSADEGLSWSPLRRSEIISPLSPASIKRIPSTGDLLLVWNNHAGIPDALVGKRTPLTLAVSEDEGARWGRRRNLEEDPNGWYCYTAIAFTDDHVLLAYCAGDLRENNGLATLQITRVPIGSL